MALSSGASALKYLLFGFNLLCALLSVAVVVIGILPLSYTDNDVTVEGASIAKLLPILLIVVGIVSFVISFFGCFGAIRLSQCLLYTYTAILAVVMFVHFLLGALIIVLMNNMHKLLRLTFDEMWFKRDEEVEFWSQMQQSLKCCGMNGASDWGSQVPASCCALASGQCRPEIAYTEGCLSATIDSVTYYGYILAFVALGSAAVQLVGFVSACVLVNRVRRDLTRGVVLRAGPSPSQEPQQQQFVVSMQHPQQLDQQTKNV